MNKKHWEISGLLLALPAFLFRCTVLSSSPLICLLPSHIDDQEPRVLSICEPAKSTEEGIWEYWGMNGPCLLYILMGFRSLNKCMNINGGFQSFVNLLGKVLRGGQCFVCFDFVWKD